jgi:hypothetical protein
MSDWFVNGRVRIGRAAAALLLIVLVAASFQAVAQTWLELRQDEVGYVVQLPGKWAVENVEVPTGVGPIKLQMAKVDLGARAYIASHSTYPEAAVRERPASAMLDGARDGAVSNVKGKLRTDEPMTVDNRPARQVVIDAPNSVVVIARYVMLDNTLIQALAVGPREVETEPATLRFLSSLKILKP